MSGKEVIFRHGSRKLTAKGHERPMPETKVEGEGSDRTWTLTLNAYQRNNLLWLLNACGYGHDGVPPFTEANTGDWLGEVANMLAHPESGLPSLSRGDAVNLSLGELARRAAEWAEVSVVMDS